MVVLRAKGCCSKIAVFVLKLIFVKYSSFERPDLFTKLIPLPSVLVKLRIPGVTKGR
jgi:hypothetical protein